MAENMAARRVHGVKRVLAKLELSVSTGNYYEAHQMYRTLYFRFVPSNFNVCLFVLCLLSDS